MATEFTKDEKSNCFITSIKKMLTSGKGEHQKDEGKTSTIKMKAEPAPLIPKNTNRNKTIKRRKDQPIQKKT